MLTRSSFETSGRRPAQEPCALSDVTGTYSSDLRLATKLSIGIGLIYLAFLAPGIYNIDEHSMLAVAESLVTHNGVAVPAGLGSAGRNGLTFSIWYPLLSFLDVPFAWLALVSSRAAHLPFRNLAAVFSLVLPCALTSATAGIVFLLSRRIGSSLRGACLASLSFAFGTVALVYARTFFAEPLLAFLTAAALHLCFGDRYWGAAAMAGLAVLAKPTGIVVGLVLAVYLMAKRKPQAALLQGLGSALGLGLYLVYNYYRYADPFEFGPPHWFRLSNIPPGVAALLASPIWGLIWYCPVVVLAVCVFRGAKHSGLFEILAISGILGSYLLLYSSWRNASGTAWDGGWSWGPRYLLPALPGICALLGTLGKRMERVIVPFILLGFLINAPTLVSYYERFFAESLEQGTPLGQDTGWSLQNAPLFHAWPAAIREARDAKHSDVGRVLQERGDSSDLISNSPALRTVAVWWWVLPILHMPRWIGCIVALALVVSGCVILIASFQFCCRL